MQVQVRRDEPVVEEDEFPRARQCDVVTDGDGHAHQSYAYIGTRMNKFIYKCLAAIALRCTAVTKSKCFCMLFAAVAPLYNAMFPAAQSKQERDPFTDLRRGI